MHGQKMHRQKNAEAKKSTIKSMYRRKIARRKIVRLKSETKNCPTTKCQTQNCSVTVLPSSYIPRVCALPSAPSLGIAPCPALPSGSVACSVFRPFVLCPALPCPQTQYVPYTYTWPLYTTYFIGGGTGGAPCPLEFCKGAPIAKCPSINFMH